MAWCCLKHSIRTEGTRMPATAAIAVRAWMSSAWTYLQKAVVCSGQRMPKACRGMILDTEGQGECLQGHEHPGCWSCEATCPGCGVQKLGGTGVETACLPGTEGSLTVGSPPPTHMLVSMSLTGARSRRAHASVLSVTGSYTYRVSFAGAGARL